METLRTLIGDFDQMIIEGGGVPDRGATDRQAQWVLQWRERMAYGADPEAR